MGCFQNVCLLLLVQFEFGLNIEDVQLNKSKRDSKQIIHLQPAFAYPFFNFVQTPMQPFPIQSPQTGVTFLANPDDQCQCVPATQCDLIEWKYYKTCHLDPDNGQQIISVCCPKIWQIPSVNSPVLSKFPNWPPPLPTHPPDHTIPPLPTHPPSHYYPGFTTSTVTTTKSTTKKPTYFSTLKPITIGTTTTRRTTTATPSTTTQQPSLDFSASCGAKNGKDDIRIVGGQDADMHEWPWIAALFNNGRQFCGGSLIDNIHILSAAHCVAHMSSWDVARLTVRLGDYNIRTNSEVKHIEKRVKRVVRHRGFDSRTLYNDIALLTLDTPVTFSSSIRPVCLPTPSGRDWAGSVGTVIGWGSIRESGPQPAVLQKVQIPIWTNSDCRLKYGHAAPGGIVEHMLCAGQAQKDSCSGDSGGPLMVNNGRWTQVGIVSWGIGCGKGQYPGVYTRVEKFLPWINKNLKQ